MYMSPIYTFFFYTAIISGLIPLLFIFIKNSKFNKFKNPILPYIVLVFIASLYEYFGSYILEINTVAWFMIYKVGAFGTLSYYFYHLLNKKFKVIFIAFTILFTVIFFINLPKVSNETFLNINGFLNAIITVFIIICAILWFKQLQWKINLNSHPNSYIIFGLLLVYCGTLFLHLFGYSIYLINKELFFSAWILNLFLNLINRLLLTFGTWKILKSHYKN